MDMFDKRNSLLDPIVSTSLCAIESENALSDIKISYETLEEKYKILKLENIEYAKHIDDLLRSNRELTEELKCTKSQHRSVLSLQPIVSNTLHTVTAELQQKDEEIDILTTSLNDHLEHIQFLTSELNTIKQQNYKLQSALESKSQSVYTSQQKTDAIANRNTYLQSENRRLREQLLLLNSQIELQKHQTFDSNSSPHTVSTNAPSPVLIRDTTRNVHWNMCKTPTTGAHHDHTALDNWITSGRSEYSTQRSVRFAQFPSTYNIDDHDDYKMTEPLTERTERSMMSDADEQEWNRQRAKDDLMERSKLMLLKKLESDKTIEFKQTAPRHMGFIDAESVAESRRSSICSTSYKQLLQQMSHRGNSVDHPPPMFINVSTSEQSFDQFEEVKEAHSRKPSFETNITQKTPLMVMNNTLRDRTKQFVQESKMTYLDYDSKPSSIGSFKELRQRNDKCRRTVFFDKSKDFVSERKMEMMEQKKSITKERKNWLSLPGKGTSILINHTNETKQFAKANKMDLLDEVLTYGSFSPQHDPTNAKNIRERGYLIVMQNNQSRKSEEWIEEKLKKRVKFKEDLEEKLDVVSTGNNEDDEDDEKVFDISCLFTKYCMYLTKAQPYKY